MSRASAGWLAHELRGLQTRLHRPRDGTVTSRRSAALRWGASLAAAGLALGFQLAAWQQVASRHMVFVAAVIFAAWFGGRWPGLVVSAGLTGALAVWFTPPLRSTAATTAGSWWVALAMFLVLSAVLTVLVSLAHEALDQQRRAELALHAAHRELESRVRERTRELNDVNQLLALGLSERKRAEVLLQRQSELLARSNAELEQFAYVASHDLQEPLRMVSSFLQLLERRYKDRLDSEGIEFIAFAVDGAKRMQLLINDLLAYSRLESQARPIAPTDCSAVVRVALANLRASIEETGAHITCDPLPTVMGDETQLAQLFQNLLSNAIKFHGEAPPEIRVSAKPDDGFWQFAVKDNGIGIAPAHYERIFLIFQRLHGKGKYQGTGIGLALCKKIVTRHGGKIWVESAPGLGSTFFFRLPRTPSA